MKIHPSKDRKGQKKKEVRSKGSVKIRLTGIGEDMKLRSQLKSSTTGAFLKILKYIFSLNDVKCKI